MTNTTKPKVLLMGPMPYVRAEFFAQVSPLAEIIQLSSSSLAEFTEQVKTTYDGLVAIYHFRAPGSWFGYLGEDFMRVLPESCKAICHLGAGYDDIDVHAAQKYGVMVTSTPSVVDDATATTAVYLIISAMRRFALAEQECRKGLWKKNLPLARDPEQKVLGIVGMGGIGSVVAMRMALGWNMRIIYHNRRKLETAPAGFACEYKETLDELLKEADVVSLHIPMNKSTENSFGKAQFQTMKATAVLVNTARGGLIVEADLIHALKTGEIYGAGLDVYPNEPAVNPELFDLPNLTLLPHMGTETTDSRDKMGLVVLRNVLDVLEGRVPSNLVPEHKKRIV